MSTEMIASEFVQTEKSEQPLVLFGQKGNFKLPFRGRTILLLKS